METLQATRYNWQLQIASAAATDRDLLGEVEEVLGFISRLPTKPHDRPQRRYRSAPWASRAGFAVVAGEVRKLAQTSNESAENISRSLQQTLDAVKQILDGVVESHRVAESQATATAEVHEALKDLAQLINQVRDVARADNGA